MFTDEAKDIELHEVLSIIISELTKLICGITRLDDGEVCKLMDTFFLSLPSHIRYYVYQPKAA
jgi:hypothetical protein